MPACLEHANLIVRDVDATISFLQIAFSGFRIRYDGRNPGGRRWVRFGNDDCTIAFSQSTVELAQRWTLYAGVPGVNRLAFEVDDVDSLRERLRAAGFEDSTVANNHPYRKRVCFYDRDSNDWEFVQHLTGKAEKRNDYELPDQ